MQTEAINHEPAISAHADRQPGDRRGRCLGAVGAATASGSLERRPADVRRAASPGRRNQRASAGDLRPAVVESGYLPGRARRGVASGPRATRSCSSTTRRACPTEVRRKTPRRTPSTLNEMNYRSSWRSGDAARGSSEYELAYRMQSSVPELTSTSARSRRGRATLYGPDMPSKPGLASRTRRPLGPADGRARRAVRADLPQQLGPPRRTSPAA